MLHFKVRQCLLALICFSLLASISACGNTTNASAVRHSDGPAIASASNSTATPVPPTQVSCPAPGTARAAIMPSIAAGNLGKDQNILYTYTDQGKGSTLRRYDVTTGKKTDLIQTTIAISSSQISSDGQWIIFMRSDSLRDTGDAIQLVRIDGQELQTLYCAKGTLFGAALAWSPNQRYLAFSPPEDGLYLLDMTSGKLRLLLRDGQGYDYRPMKWANNTDLYVTNFVNGSHATSAGDGLGGALGHNELYLIQNITSEQNINPAHITIPTLAGESGDECQDFDVSPDNTHLLYSDCRVQITPNPPQSDTISYNGPSTIASQSLTGGHSTAIYQTSTHGIHYARYISSSTILFVDFNTVMDTNRQGGLWKINTDGSGLTQLVSTQSTVQKQDVILDLEEMNIPGYRPSFSVSPDGRMFALGIEHDSSHNTVSLLFGSLNGGSTTTFATTDVLDSQNFYSVSLVGWVTL